MAIPEIRTVVVTVGSIGELHVRLYDEHHRTNVAVVIDHDEERAQTVAESYGVDSVEIDLETTLERYDLDAVTIATPEATHRKLVETTLGSDVAVLLEKPIADSMTDARAIGAATDRSDGDLLMGFVCQFDPRYATLRERINGGELGAVYAVRAARIVNSGVRADRGLNPPDVLPLGPRHRHDALVCRCRGRNSVRGGKRRPGGRIHPGSRQCNVALRGQNRRNAQSELQSITSD